MWQEFPPIHFVQRIINYKLSLFKALFLKQQGSTSLGWPPNNNFCKICPYPHPAKSYFLQNLRCNLFSICNVKLWNRIVNYACTLSIYVKGGSVTSVANEVTLPKVADTECAQFWSVPAINRLCAGYNLAGKGICPGDSGGPLSCQVRWNFKQDIACMFHGYLLCKYVCSEITCKYSCANFHNLVVIQNLAA